MSMPKVNGYAIVEKIGSGSYAIVYKAFKKVRDMMINSCGKYLF